MRSATRPLPSTRDRLLSIAHVVDSASADLTGARIVSVELDGDDVVLGVRDLPAGVHPVGPLAGLVAPEQWWALCIVTHGRAHFLDEPDRAPEDIVSTFALARDGSEASLLRRGDDVMELPGPTTGRIPDLLRTILG